MTLRVRVTRWRCSYSPCGTKFFSSPLPGTAHAFARQTDRAAAITLLVGQALGGRASERLINRLGLPVSDDTILRRLKRGGSEHKSVGTTIVGIDDWAQKKGENYGTIVVDLERSCVVDLVAGRSAGSVTTWLEAHPEVQTISRDRNGLYAQGARQAAPQAKQIADPFHLVKNLREAVQSEVSLKRRHLAVSCELMRRQKRLLLQEK